MPPPPTPDPPADAVAQLLRHDAFSRFLGLQLAEVRPGYCRLHFLVRPDMLNGFGVVHGGVTFAAADSAFAFACNTHGRPGVGLTATIDYLTAGRVGDVLTVEAQEEALKRTIGVYQVRITNQNGTLLALFKGTAYRPASISPELTDT